MRACRLIALLSPVWVSGCTDQGRVLFETEQGTPGAVRADVLAAGPYHTCALDSGGLRCWGGNDSGQLGIGDVADRDLAAALGGADWVEVVAGERHSCARRTAGSVWCWGDNQQGQLGQGTFDSGTLLPGFVSTNSGAQQLASTYHHTCAIDDTQALHCWGANEEGQLGQDDPFSGDGVDRATPTRVGQANDWFVVDAGQGHTCALRSQGSLYCWGRNLRGELGLGASAAGQLRTPQHVAGFNDWTDVRVGQISACALRAGGQLYCWGGNDFGEQGHGDQEIRYEPTRVGADSDWSQISTDTFHTCGIRSDGALYCWGRNFEGQLGLGDTVDRLSPTRLGSDNDWTAVAAGRFHTCASKQDGSVYCVGQNDRGQLGLGDRTTRLTLTQLTLAP